MVVFMLDSTDDAYEANEAIESHCYWGLFYFVRDYPDQGFQKMRHQANWAWYIDGDMHDL
jgi:hypothetical protein